MFVQAVLVLSKQCLAEYFENVSIDFEALKDLMRKNKSVFAHLHFTGVHTRCDLVSHFPVNQLTTRYTRSTTKWKQYFFNSSNKYVKLKKETCDIDVVRFF